MPPNIGVLAIRNTLVITHVNGIECPRRIKMTEEARRLLIACADHRTMVAIEVPCFNSETEIAVFDFILWKHKYHPKDSYRYTGSCIRYIKKEWLPWHNT